jgi:hypothetical protein
MPLPITVKDGYTLKSARVNADGALKVFVAQSSSDVPIEELTRLRQLREPFVNGGGAEMNVNGSVAPVEYVVEAEEGFTKWITGVRFLLKDKNMEINTNDFRRFGDAAIAPGLTNGVEFWANQGGTITPFFISPVKKIGGFLDYADDFTNLVNAISSQDDFLSFDFYFDAAAPVVLPAGSTDRLVIKINDDLTTVESFRAIARGYQEETG